MSVDGLYGEFRNTMGDLAKFGWEYVSVKLLSQQNEHARHAIHIHQHMACHFGKLIDFFVSNALILPPDTLFFED